MGVTKYALKNLIDDFNKRGQRPHGKLLTLSRYQVVFSVDDFNHIAKSSGWDARINDEGKKGLLLNDEVLFKALGFEHIDSMDYSDFEGANIIHDLNDVNIPKELIGKYDFIFDGGTIEHIFNVPNVFENIFNMLAVGGTFYFELPATNILNHGFYNFHPCFVYDYFSACNYTINAVRPVYVRGDEWLELDSVINNLNIPISNFGGMLIYGSVTKTSDTSHAIPFQGAYLPIWQTNCNKVIYDTLIDSNDNSVYFYGTGGFVRNVIAMLPTKHRKKLSGLLSKDEDEIGTYKYGYMVYGIDEVTDRCDTVIIATTKTFQDIIYRRISHLEKDGVKIIKLF